MMVSDWRVQEKIIIFHRPVGCLRLIDKNQCQVKLSAFVNRFSPILLVQYFEHGVPRV